MTNPISPSAENTKDAISIPALIGLALLTRLLVDTGIQIFFPFLPVIAAGLGITAVTLGRLVSIRSSTGLLSPIFGSLADRYGYRLIMRLGLLIAALGYLLIASATGLWTAVLGMILGGIGTFGFVPNLQAYLSARLPYHQRARGLAIPEYGWALSGIIGLWAMGELIAATNWQVPFYLISGSCFLLFFVFGWLPASDGRSAPREATPTTWRTFFNLGDNRRSVAATLGVAGLVMFAGMLLFINYGSWLVDEYALGPAELGRVALILGIADLAGSGIVSVVGDRLGKRRMVLLGAVPGVVGFALLPVWGVTLSSAVAGLLLTRFCFETAVVGNLTLLSEQIPNQRGKIMTLGAAAALLGSTFAGFIGPWLYDRDGIWPVTTLSAIAMFIITLLVWRHILEDPENEAS